MYGVNVPKGFSVMDIKRGIKLTEYDGSVKRVNVVFMRNRDKTQFKVDVIEHSKTTKVLVQMSCGKSLFNRLKDLFHNKAVSRQQIDDALMS